MSSFPLIERNLLDRHRGIFSADRPGPIVTSSRRRYWPSAGVKSSVFQARFPDAKLLVRMGQCAANRRIRYWHPWHMEQTQSDYILSKDIDWFTPPNGDHEWIESLVRFDHMIDLAAAHALTGQWHYIDSFTSYLRSFSYSRSIPGRHWQYKLNPALRIINLIRAYDLLIESLAPDDPLHFLVYECILTDADFLKKKVDDATGNGAFFVTVALLTAALYLEEIFSTDAWKISASSRLFQILKTEIQDDGFEAEQVPMYHGEVLLTLLDYCVALASNGCLIDDRLEITSRRLLKAIGRVSDPQGMIPPIGDSDRFDVKYLYGFYNSIFGEQASLEGDWTEDGVVQGGSSAVFQIQQLPIVGWTIVRWRRDKDRRGYLLFDCSGKPRSGYGNHSHADDLQFLLHDCNGPIITDPGRFTYCTEFKAFFPWTRRRINPTGRFRRIYRLLFPAFMKLTQRNWKEYFRSTLSHNTVSCDEWNQPGYDQRIANGAPVRLARQLASGPLIFLEGVLECADSLDGDAASMKYSHRRNLIGIHPDLWIVVDRVDSARKRQWISSFHVDMGCRISSQSEFQLIEVNGGVHQFFGASGLGELGCTISIEDDWISPLYNLKLPAKTIRIRSQRAEAAELIGIVYTGVTRRQRMERVEMVPVLDDSGFMVRNNFLIHLVRNDVVTRVLVNPDGFECCLGDLSSDAAVAYVSHSGSQLLEAGFCSGKYLKCGDLNLVANDGADALHHTIS